MAWWRHQGYFLGATWMTGKHCCFPIVWKQVFWLQIQGLSASRGGAAGLEPGAKSTIYLGFLVSAPSDIEPKLHACLSVDLGMAGNETMPGSPFCAAPVPHHQVCIKIDTFYLTRSRSWSLSRSMVLPRLFCTFVYDWISLLPTRVGGG